MARFVYLFVLAGLSLAKTVYVDPAVYAVLGSNGPFRQLQTDFWNPTNETPPFFQVFDESFVTDVLGDDASIHQIASEDSWTWAWEAPTYVAETDEFFFASSSGDPLGSSGIDKNNRILKLDMSEVENALQDGTQTANVSVSILELDQSLQLANGATGPFNGNILVVGSGRGNLPSSLVALNPHAPYNLTVLLDNFMGRQFNSLNDIRIHPKSGNIFMTDPFAGYYNGIRPEPGLPSQVYRFDPKTSAVRVVADGFVTCNGIAFTEDGKTVYIGDSGSRVLKNQTLPATIYTFDVDEETESFANRRVFAFTDTRTPDGVHVDTNGYVYAGTGEGVEVFNSQGTLVGKIFLGISLANFGWAGPGRMVIMAGTKLYLVRLKSAETKQAW